MLPSCSQLSFAVLQLCLINVSNRHINSFTDSISFETMQLAVNLGMSTHSLFHIAHFNSLADHVRLYNVRQMAHYILDAWTVETFIVQVQNQM